MESDMSRWTLLTKNPNTFPAKPTEPNKKHSSKNTKQLKANTGRKRLNLNGAYNAQSTILLMEQIMGSQLSGMIYLIADNAKYYRSKKVKEFLEKNVRVKIVFLPPYSLNLNVIERLWLFFKKKQLWNQCYEKYDEFKKQSMEFFKNIHLYKTELQTLMTAHFQLLHTA